MLINKDELIKKLRSGEIPDLDALNGVLRGMIKEVVETAMGAGLTDFLGYDKNKSPEEDDGNRRNGYSKKEVASKLGAIEPEVPRDRKAGFSPAIIKKRKRHLDGFEDLILSMYSKGMTTRDIQGHIKEIYNFDISPEAISRITDAVIEQAREWQNRPLESVYAIVFMDALYLKLRVDGRVKKAAYRMPGITITGQKECPGIWIGQNESSKFWRGLPNELRNRGVNEVWIFAVDGLTGFPEAIHAAYPESDIQRCIVHQLRNSLGQMSWKDRKAAAASLKYVYTAPTEEEGLKALDQFEEEWEKKYPHVVRSWRANWPELSSFFRYPEEVRRLIYTTNPIESLNSRVRKAVNGRLVFPTEMAMFKALYLAVQEAGKRWTSSVRNWAGILGQLSIYYQERLTLYLH